MESFVELKKNESIDKIAIKCKNKELKKKKRKTI